MAYSYQDPQLINWCALYLAIKWHKQITVEQSLRIAIGTDSFSRPQTLTPQMLINIQIDITRRKRMRIRGSWNYIENKYRVSRWSVMEALKQ